MWKVIIDFKWEVDLEMENHEWRWPTKGTVKFHRALQNTTQLWFYPTQLN